MNIRCDKNEIPKAIDFIRNSLEKNRAESKNITKTLLTCEEVLNAIINNSSGDEVSIKLTSFLGNTEVRISAKGKPFDISAIENQLYLENDPEANAIITEMMRKLMGDSISLVSKCEVNTACIGVSKSKYKQLAITILALVLGIAVGFIFKYALPQNIVSGITDNVFSPVNTMFLNALKMIVAPLVFFSIASSIADFGNIKALGRIAGKVVGSYFMTSIVAILIGTGVYFILPIGAPELVNSVSSETAANTIQKGEAASASVINTIVNIVPSDIANPVLNANMLQIIFIAVMIGVASGMLAGKLYSFKNMLEDCYAVFSKITTMIINIMPVAIFCSMAKMVISIKAENMLSVFAWVPTIYIADIIMLTFYAVMIFVFARINPMKFFKGFYPAMLSALTFSSSNATLPTSMECCGKNLGISKKIYAFSLPLGATINMDGNCITQMISALFMAKIFSIPITPSMLTSLFLSIFILSVGAPGVPGGALVCISILLPQIGVPAEAISIVMGLYSLVEMMQTCVNVTGDASVTLITAKSEKLIDLKVYDS